MVEFWCHELQDRLFLAIADGRCDRVVYLGVNVRVYQNSVGADLSVNKVVLVQQIDGRRYLNKRLHHSKAV